MFVRQADDLQAQAVVPVVGQVHLLGHVGHRVGRVEAPEGVVPSFRSRLELKLVPEDGGEQGEGGLLPAPVEVEAVGDDRLGVLRQGAGEHVGDHVVGVGGHEAVGGGMGGAATC